MQEIIRVLFFLVSIMCHVINEDESKYNQEIENYLMNNMQILYNTMMNFGKLQDGADAGNIFSELEIQFIQEMIAHSMGTYDDFEEDYLKNCLHDLAIIAEELQEGRDCEGIDFFNSKIALEFIKYIFEQKNE